MKKFKEKKLRQIDKTKDNIASLVLKIRHPKFKLPHFHSPKLQNAKFKFLLFLVFLTFTLSFTAGHLFWYYILRDLPAPTEDQRKAPEIPRGNTVTPSEQMAFEE